MPSINCLYDAGFRSLQIAPASSEFVPASSDLCKRGLNGRVYGRCRSPLAVRHVFPGVVAGMAISVAGPRGAEIGLVVLGALIVASIVWHLLKKSHARYRLTLRPWTRQLSRDRLRINTRKYHVPRIDDPCLPAERSNEGLDPR